jgi:hypothetical protein
MKKSELRQLIREEIKRLKDGTKLLGKKGKYKVLSKDGIVWVVYNNETISIGDFDRGADGWFLSITGQRGQEFFDTPTEILDYFIKNKITK